MKSLTKRQGEIVEYIRSCLESGTNPSVRDIMRKFKFKSPNAVMSHLKLIENKGIIERRLDSSRRIVFQVNEGIMTHEN